MIKVGEKLPSVTVHEYVTAAANGYAVGPNPVSLDVALAKKRIVLFGLPGAYTPTCSAKHLPGYIEHADALVSKGVDEIWCLSVNDAFVMHAWGKEHNVGTRVRMIADGNAELTKAIGLTLNLTARGMGLRSDRYSMLIDNGVVARLNVEAPGKLEVSDAETMLSQLTR